MRIVDLISPNEKNLQSEPQRGSGSTKTARSKDGGNTLPLRGIAERAHDFRLKKATCRKSSAEKLVVLATEGKNSPKTVNRN